MEKNVDIFQLTGGAVSKTVLDISSLSTLVKQLNLMFTNTYNNRPAIPDCWVKHSYAPTFIHNLKEYIKGLDLVKSKPIYGAVDMNTFTQNSLKQQFFLKELPTQILLLNKIENFDNCRDKKEFH